ncbi:MAG: dihydroneopterin aldolase [Actinomycetota bacterium]|nr:dihydroneopterin aldolase [Actinomycetota bacterium]
MPDQIAIRGIRGTGRHGVFEHERVDGQEFVIDVVLDVSTVAAGASDALVDTVDYGDVAMAVHALIVGEPVDLIEALAERVAGACLGFPGVLRAEVTVHKPHAPVPVPFDDVTVRIVRPADA